MTPVGFAMTYDVLVWGHEFDLLALLGIVLVVVALIVRERFRRSKRLKSPLLAAGEAVSSGASSDAQLPDSQPEQGSERS